MTKKAIRSLDGEQKLVIDDFLMAEEMKRQTINIKLLVPAPLDGVTPECLFVFSCGHNYSSHILQEEVLPELESRLQPLPNTARMLKEVYNADSPSIHLACPRCLLEYLKIHTDMVM
uniref:Uncharacterized protein n=1 Tax=Timema monikensis TaxID=170555 RepID=A0A7R9ED30_9NEOP|nr:unnamed protein product [Timema monikensis]